jgi:hypothetical protein
MTLRYNINKLLNVAHSDPTKVINLLRGVLNPASVSQFTRKIIYENKGFTGSGWVINPSVISDKSVQVSARHRVEYLMLCALRPYEDYIFYGYIHLPINLARGLYDEENPLLELEGNGNILFHYEQLMKAQ